jgi:hypothetical protein
MVVGVAGGRSTGTAQGSNPTIPAWPAPSAAAASTTTTATPAERPVLDDGALGVAGGMVRHGDDLSPFDVDVPAVANLDPALLRAVQAAARDAAARGVHLHLNSGWRSRAYQQALLDAAIAEHGEGAARRIVATPDSSHHVTGEAVDVGPTAADDWLQRHGAAYGLCRAYANEIWHFELSTTPGGDCPPMKADATAG